ncbi:VCBS repeat-containing protein [Fibrella sp. HMF5335]|uniref:VCBS repeat-containing protein n=1 Tax=Fibrella rubiginis TaxID=2817060 RepID=A0A939K5J4_9BACT|nr:VCBS repeat-containing protein [Fibrella rubiginis]MBO0939549.1 VCBS repeat-containing protein [Fibrella rubiginis]
MPFPFKLMRLVSTLCVLASLLACQDKPETGDDTLPGSSLPDGPPLFTALSAEQTGIGFQNTLTEGLNTNILLYEYFYNGGGVATGDFNGDGWIDAYFTANLSDNKLYLNKGHKSGESIQFQDVTEASGAGGRSGPWKTGVTTVDINADGKLDLYVCYSGALPPEKRTNQLFVNQGNDTGGVPHFVDQAATYGLDHPGFSNQAYFLDYDRDGDLDMLLLNHNPKNLPILNEASTAEMLRLDDPERGLRVLKQTAGHFADVTQQAGVNGSALSYGLGLGIADVNDDGWLDFYVSNDYAVPDYLYINQQNGTFRNEVQRSLGHTSQFSMGNDVADVNNDGRADIFTLDMLPEDNHRQKLLLAPDNFAKFDLNVRSGFYYQYMRNMLQLNAGKTGEGTSIPLFSEVGQLAGVSNTDWSWAALLADFDNDGWKDLFVTNGYFRDYTNLDFIKYMDDYAQRKGRLQREDVLEIIGHMPASNVVNYVFQNQKGASFANRTQSWGINTPSNSNGAAYADLDNDGDLDLLVNNINQPAFVYRNDAEKSSQRHFLQVRLTGAAGNTQGIGTRVNVFANGLQQSQMQTLTRGYLSSVSPVMQFGLGSAATVDSVVVTWAAGKRQTLRQVKANQVIDVNEKQATDGRTRPATPAAFFTQVPSPVDYADPVQAINDFDRQPLLTRELSHNGPCQAVGDVNADGLPDLFVGGAMGQSAGLYLQQKGGRFARQSVPAFDADKAAHDAAAAFFDANGDGSTDLYVASGGYHNLAATDPRLQDRLYLNDGKGHFSKSPDALPPMPTSKGCVAVGDANADGHPDLFVGGRVVPGSYPETPASYLLVNDGKGKFTDQTAQLAPDLQRVGMVTDAAWVDMDGNGKAELVVAGEWMPVSIFGQAGGRFVNKTNALLGKAYVGWWNKITVGDVNGDKKPDLLVGNWGENSQVRASPSQPTDLYFADFDKNGTVEPILCCYIQGKSHLFLTRDELLNQIGGYRTRYPTYASYADATVKQVFDSETLSAAGHLKANHLQTTCFLSNPSGRYTLGTLPVQAQYAPVHTITLLDADHDGRQDVLLCGNDSHVKIRLGKMDANYGVLLRGDGRGGFSYVEQPQSGFGLTGDVRSVTQLNDLLLFGINERKMVAYKLKK